ncbi:MAG: metallophosphoesterase [Acidobacteriota bacterium]|nr:metallophosphoesterase [Acidobacteriota bacterium]
MSSPHPAADSVLTRRRFLLGTATAAAAMTLYAGEVARHELDVVRRTIQIPSLPDAFHGYRIVQISDIHLDEFTEPSFLQHTVHRINELQPDVVLITGDFVTQGAFTFVSARHAAYRAAEILAGLQAPERYAVLGNHDVTVGSAMVTDALTASGTPVLTNRYIPLERRGGRVWLAGIDDPNTSHPNLDLALPARPNAPILLMSHGPDFTDTILQHPRGKYVDLVLAGHSHGGQVDLPFLGPLVLPPGGKLYPHGYYRFGRTQLYVNRGLGTVGVPFRFNCPPEITVLTLQGA